MMGFEGFSSWSLDILCGQSVSISRDLYIRAHNFQCSKLLLRFEVVFWGQKEHGKNLSVFLIIMPILWLVCIKQEESIVTVCKSLLRQLKNLEHYKL
jgi:hypothetical protein